jgi:flagellar basal-body rod protein FlgF
MNSSLYQAAAGMKATARWQEVISENLASSVIPGFKRQTLSFSAVQAGLMAPSSTGTRGGDRHFAMPNSTLSTNFAFGEIRPGDPDDLAIDGPGFFEVQLPNGTKAYTRDGEFRRNAQGQLVSKQGFPVQGTAGSIQLDPNNRAPVAIAPTGEISQGGLPVGTIRVVDFADYRRLSGLGGGLFGVFDPGVTPTPVPRISVQQGFVEAANTSTVAEMSDLLYSVRLFEANQKIVQSQDERLGKLIADIGNPN